MAPSGPHAPGEHGASGYPEAEEKLIADSGAKFKLSETARKRTAVGEASKGRQRSDMPRKLQDELTEVRARLKEWEKRFAEQHKRKPEQTDIRASPEMCESGLCK